MDEVHEEIVAVISLMKGTPQLVVKLLYGFGVRILEALRLRVHDMDYDLKQITVRSGKGNKDREPTAFRARMILLISSLF